MTAISFDVETIRVLAAILEERGLTEVEMRDGEQHLRLMRAPAPMHAPPPAAPTHVAVTPAPVAAPEPGAAHEPPPPAGAVPSPMVGIAYLSSEPGSAPFVTVGQTVAAGQTLLLIEAMKTFNQIKAPNAGTVTRILVASGEPVEYGQPLMVVG